MAEICHHTICLHINSIFRFKVFPTIDNALLVMDNFNKNKKKARPDLLGDKLRGLQIALIVALFKYKLENHLSDNFKRVNKVN